MRSKNADNAIVLFVDTLQKRRYAAIKDITAAAGVGATIGGALKALGYVRKIGGAYYYTGPDKIPVEEIAAKYYEIRERHKAGQTKARNYPNLPPETVQRNSGALVAQTYTKEQVIERFKTFYVREYGKLNNRAYTLIGYLLTALEVEDIL